MAKELSVKGTKTDPDRVYRRKPPQWKATVRGAKKRFPHHSLVVLEDDQGAVLPRGTICHVERIYPNTNGNPVIELTVLYSSTPRHIRHQYSVRAHRCQICDPSDLNATVLRILVREIQNRYQTGGVW